MNDRYLSVAEICTYLGVKRDTVYKWISKKKLPAHRIGKLWKFKISEIDDWVKNGNRRSMSNSI
ncbi:MAG: helix-turn-helix domain-containing protein [Candidatus Marinimicrobia bacterium]|nr:helix-turn-helix domain-containing protein [Candidatus Neomarinimicrobiota bacterium]